MLEPKYTNEFLKCLKRDKKRGLDLELLQNLMKRLANEEILEPKYRDHELSGNYKGYRECHVKPNWLLLYYTSDDSVVFCKTGTHSDLF